MQDEGVEPEMCRLATPLDDIDLLAALDGEADPEVMAHLRECPACVARMREYAALQALLHRRLYRALCPSSEALAAFQQGMLEGGRSAMVVRHVAECPHCARELRLLAEVFTPQTPRR
jgi:anti-sigma factor RsiW